MQRWLGMLALPTLFELELVRISVLVLCDSNRTGSCAYPARSRVTGSMLVLGFIEAGSLNACHRLARTLRDSILARCLDGSDLVNLVFTVSSRPARSMLTRCLDGNDLVNLSSTASTRATRATCLKMR